MADSADLFRRIRFRGNPVANQGSIVISGNVRFSVLTPHLIRLEWSENGAFEDRSTYAFPTRAAPPPSFTVQSAGNELVLKTEFCSVRYVKSAGPFTAQNLSVTIRLGSGFVTWVPGASGAGNLRGTRRTLDGCAGDAALEPGLLSRDGWVLFDDSQSVLYDPESGWPLPRPGHALQDWYFFGYGHDYQAALADYARFGGTVPLIPRFMLGAWWSRYWAYSSEDLKRLVRDFERYDLPLDVLVIDMDWHTPHGWTGYSWNRQLFPDPAAFLKWVHDKDLRATLNLHPAQGVGPHEDMYDAFALSMGLDPNTRQAVQFRITDRQFVKNYFELLHHPLEDDGVDFWWLDWQQGESTEMPGLDALPWLNHLHHSDSQRRGLRPMLYSRWGGLGNHRYPIGFSGDTWVSWEALQFQPFFTATASNVLFGWWSHDIGGHMGGPTEPELFARWVQFGALSPVLRLHATKDPRAERRPWKFPAKVFRVVRSAFHLRYAMVPYLYSLARCATDSGVGPCRPMYYGYPEEDGAYAARHQFLLGDQMIVAPIVHPANTETGMASTDVWIPPGTWIDIQTRESFTGPRWVRLFGGLDRLPRLVRTGTVLPLAGPFTHRSPPSLASGTTCALPQDVLVISVFPGAEGSFRLYQDDGLTEAYKHGECEWTEIVSHIPEPDRWEVRIGAAEGQCPALPERRGYQVRLECSHHPTAIMVDGAQIAHWTYNVASLRTIIDIPPRDTKQAVTIIALAEDSISMLGSEHNRLAVRRDVQRLLGLRPSPDQSLHELFGAARACASSSRADAFARLGGPLVQAIQYSTPEEAAERLGLVIVGGPAIPAEPYDVTVRFTRLGPGIHAQSKVSRERVTGSQLIETPFAFAGKLEPVRWLAEVTLKWRDVEYTCSFRSRPYFPTVYAWQLLVQREHEGPLCPQAVMEEDGRPRPGLKWHRRIQDLQSVASLQEPHILRSRRDSAFDACEGTRARTYLATCIQCPDTRPAVLRFRAPAPLHAFLNGLPVREAAVRQECEAVRPLLRKERKTTSMDLQPGSNFLLLCLEPPPDHSAWFFEGSLTTPEGEVMVDVSYRLPSDIQVAGGSS